MQIYSQILKSIMKEYFWNHNLPVWKKRLPHNPMKIYILVHILIEKQEKIHEYISKITKRVIRFTVQKYNDSTLQWICVYKPSDGLATPHVRTVYQKTYLALRSTNKGSDRPVQAGQYLVVRTCYGLRHLHGSSWRRLLWENCVDLQADLIFACRKDGSLDVQSNAYSQCFKGPYIISTLYVLFSLHIVSSFHDERVLYVIIISQHTK